MARGKRPNKKAPLPRGLKENALPQFYHAADRRAREDKPMRHFRITVKRTFVFSSNVTIDIWANSIDLVFKGYNWLAKAAKGRLVPARKAKKFLQVINEAV